MAGLARLRVVSSPPLKRLSRSAAVITPCTCTPNRGDGIQPNCIHPLVMFAAPLPPCGAFTPKYSAPTLNPMPLG